MRGSRLATFFFAILLVAGCGGSDWYAPVAITAENAEEVSGIAVEMIGFSSELAYLLQDYWFLIEKGFPSGNYPCDGGGSFTATVQDLAPTGELSTGDRVVLQFFDCQPDSGNPGYRVNGAFTFNVDSATVSGPEEEYVIRYTLSGLELQIDGLTFLYEGALLATHWTDDQILFTTEVGIDSLRWTLDVPAVGTFEQEIRNARLVEEVNDIDGDWIATIEGEFYDSGVGGVMTVETTLPFEGTDDDPPDTGIFVIHGLNDSFCRLRAMGGDDVRLEIDEDGDGTVDSTIDTTWDAISPG